MGRAGARMLVTTEPLVTIPHQISPLPDAEWVARDADLTLLVQAIETVGAELAAVANAEPKRAAS